MLQGRSYTPLLHARMAEIRALRELPDTARPLIFPVIKLRPWLNSKTLQSAYEVIDGAVAGQPFGFDLDDFAYDPMSDKPARQEFARLFDASSGYENYYNAVSEEANRIPVLRAVNHANSQIPVQLKRVSDLDRGLIVRVIVADPGRYLDVAQRCIAQDIDNAVFIFDCGWRENLLPQAAICAGLVNSLLDITEDYEIVIAGSSFPKAFGGNGSRFSISASERPLYQQVRAVVNRGDLHYGDWASTRPPADPTPMRNVPRIDRAQLNEWNSWRSDDEDYQELAERVVDDPLWGGNLDIWGDYMIQCTADGEEPAIKSAAMAAAVRINLHMVTQANADQPGQLSIGDERVGDDL